MGTSNSNIHMNIFLEVFVIWSELIFVYFLRSCCLNSESCCTETNSGTLVSIALLFELVKETMNFIGKCSDDDAKISSYMYLDFFVDVGCVS